MVTQDVDPRTTIARLESKVAMLEHLLASRSRLLRKLAIAICDEDLENLSRLAAGRPPRPRVGNDFRDWRETISFSAGDVEKTMVELWRSAARSRPD